MNKYQEISKKTSSSRARSWKTNGGIVVKGTFLTIVLSSMFLLLSSSTTSNVSITGVKSSSLGLLDSATSILSSPNFEPFWKSILPTTTAKNASDQEDTCAQVPPWSWKNAATRFSSSASAPTNEQLDERYKTHFSSPNFKEDLIKRFQGAIRIESVSYDSMRGGPKAGEDQFNPTLHAPFLKLHKHLQDSYPLVHQKLKWHVVNNYSLVYEWKGSDKNLKPAMLMAHQDVVPVDPQTVNDWFYPPFSATLNEKEQKIYGRGTTDTKLTLITILEAVEALLEVDFQPGRSWILAFGHDEEISGFNGIEKIVEYLQSSSGGGIEEYGVEFINDEGGAVLKLPPSTSSEMKSDTPIYGAYVSISEKGYMDTNITVTMKKGGHASLPPPHTAIGILSEMIVKLEENPFPPLLGASNPMLNTLSCLAEHTDSVSSYQKFILSHLPWTTPLLYKWFEKVPKYHASITTTQGVDIINGGVKVNAIPTSAYAVVNMRINPHESVAGVSTRISELLGPLALKHGLDFRGDVSTHSMEGGGGVGKDGVVSQIGEVLIKFDGLEPSPVSPTNSEAFKKFSSVIRRVFGGEKEGTIVVPALMIANTDTKFTWTLTRNIFRFNPFITDGGENIHTVNEYCRVESLVGSVGFYHELIRAFDE